MKYFVISDIHGDAKCLAQALEVYNSSFFTGMIILGDYLYHGPRNKIPLGYDTTTTYELLNSKSSSIIGVRGNCDSEVDQMMLKFPMMETYLTLSIGDLIICLTHGHHTLDEPNAPKKVDIVLSGHTHLPKAEIDNGIIYLNPGSISLPKGGNPKSYGILSDHNFTIYTLDENKEMMSINF